MLPLESPLATEASPVRPAPPRGWWPALAVAVAASGFITLLERVPVLSLPGTLVYGPIALGLLAGFLYSVPALLAALTPALIPMGAVWVVFPYEILFALLALVVVVREIGSRSPRLRRMDGIERSNLALILWAAFTGLWCTSFPWYVHGVRRMVLGFAAYWVARRMARWVPKPLFEAGLLAAAATLSLAALGHFASLGLNVHFAALRRSEATDLGWATANFVATLLLMLAPPALDLALHGAGRLARASAWIALALVALMQTIIASRAASVLFIAGVVVQVAGRTLRRGIGLVVVLGAVAGLVVSPLGQILLARFTSLREFASIPVRIWYARVAWQRVLDHLPFGMGLNQGWDYADRLFGTDPHNYWLALASELGVFGVLGWLVVLSRVYGRIRALTADPAWRNAGRALQISFWLGQLHTLVEPTFQGAQYQYLFFWLVGGTLGYWEASRETTPAAASWSR